MSTRAVYTFTDENGSFHVYKHHDGYPSGAVEWIENAKSKAWEGTRFEACEFGAAFVAANKKGGGGVYLTHTYEDHGDLEYRYEITTNGKDLIVNAYEVTGFDEQKSRLLFTGTIEEMKQWITKYERI